MIKRKGKLPPFVGIGRLTMATKEWRELSPSAKITYMQLKYHFNGHNNGKISVSMRTLAKGTNLHFMTICRAIKELKEKGWVDKTEYGGMFNNMNAYRLTGKYDNWIKDETKQFEIREQGSMEHIKQKKIEELRTLVRE